MPSRGGIGNGNVPNIPTGFTSGAYLLTSSPNAATTSAALGNQTLRLLAWFVSCPISIAKIGAAVVTTPGESGSKFRPAIYNDNGGGYPGTVALDPGVIDGTSATVQSITLGSATVLQRGLYWIGGACQLAPTTQPTMQITSGWHSPVPIQSTSAFAAGAAVCGYSMNSIGNGALPTFTALAGNQSSLVPRIFVQIS